MIKKLCIILISVLISTLTLPVFAAYDNKPPVFINSNPKQKEINVPIGATIKIKFDEQIVKGSFFNKIILSDAKNRVTPFVPTISGVNLTICPKNKLNYNSSYSVKIPAGALKDKAGNLLKSKLLLVFYTEKKSISTNIPSTSSSNKTKKDVEDPPQPCNLEKEAGSIVEGVKEICPNGWPSPLQIFDSSWKPIISGDEDSSYAIFAAARAYGNGRIFAIGQETLLQNETLYTKDNLQFCKNIIKWLGCNVNGSKGVGITFSHKERLDSILKIKNLSSSLSDNNYMFNGIYSNITKDSLEGINILIIGNSWSDFSNSEIRIIKEFVSNGGGLLLCGLGWSYYAYNHGDYPMNTLASEFGINFQNSSIAEKDDLLDNTPILHTIYPDITYSTLDQAIENLQRISSIFKDNLSSVLENDSDIYNSFSSSLLTLQNYECGSHYSDQVYDFCKSFAQDYPQYFSKKPTYDFNTYSKITWLREKFFRVWIDSKPLNESVKSEIATLGQLTGKYLILWEKYSIYTADNNSLDQTQLDEILKILDLIPQNYHNVRVISCSDFLGKKPENMEFSGKEEKINIFGCKVAQNSENSFTSEVSPGMTDIFSMVVVHEINHVIDALKQRNDSGFFARRALLINEAGRDPSHYLRGFPEGFFVDNPQEFFASMSNQWFTDSYKMLELGIEHYKKGDRNAINQALFFADSYSNGSDTTYFYNLDVRGNIYRENVTLGRDNLKRINSLIYNGKEYSFCLDSDGDVTGYTIKDKKVAFICNQFYNAA